jgi:hypothetical protein
MIRTQRFLAVLVGLSVMLTGLARAQEQPTEWAINLPLVVVPRGSGPVDPDPTIGRRVFAPYIASQDIIGTSFAEMAIFWFGRIDQTSNYTDVRVAYSNDALEVSATTFDRQLWYDTSPSAGEIPGWDAASLLISQEGGDTLDSSSVRFDAQLSMSNSAANQAAYRGDGSGWAPASIPFSAQSGWRGASLNNPNDDRGWVINYRIPFSSLGLSGAPADGTTWRIGLRVYDRDDQAGTPVDPQFWPPAQELTIPSSWGALSYGLPGYTSPAATQPAVVTIAHRLNGADVPDGMVGGGFTCGDGSDFWTQWGNLNYEQLPNNEGRRADFNIQNQSDIADWPCFSKNYLTFPLNGLPAGKRIISAKLVLHQFGNAQPQDATPSLIQVFRVAEPWSDETITWNTAPLALENIGRGWVDPLPTTAPWPGVAREIDISWAVAQAYAAGTPLSLALYSADSDYHSGKYFVGSNTGDWNAAGRPALVVTLGDAP